MWCIIIINNNSVQFFIIYVPSQQLQGQLQTQHSADKSNYIMGKHNIKSKTNYSKYWRKNTLMQKSKQTNKVIIIIIILLTQI
jgi:hypothetical protein